MEQKYINGLFVYAPHEKAPDFVKAKLSINVERLQEWLSENKALANEKGFISIDIKEGRDKKWYAQVDNWKPENKSVSTDEERNLEDVPF